MKLGTLNIKYLALLCLAIIVGLGCSAEDEIDDELIQIHIEENIEDYLKLVRFSCSETLLKEADLHVDSLIMEEIRYSIVDTLVFPGRPNKPVFPYPIILDDSTAIVPLLLDSIRGTRRGNSDTLIVKDSSMTNSEI